MCLSCPLCLAVRKIRKYTYIHIYTPGKPNTPPPHPTPPTHPMLGRGGACGGVGGVGWVGYLVCLVCIYVYMYICVFRDSHFQRLSKHIFNFGFLGFPLSAPFQKHFQFCFFMIFGVPDPGKSWEIVGNCRPSPGNRGKSLGDRGESWKWCPIPNSRGSVLSLYILRTHTRTH